MRGKSQTGTEKSVICAKLTLASWPVALLRVSSKTIPDKNRLTMILLLVFEILQLKY